MMHPHPVTPASILGFMQRHGLHTEAWRTTGRLRFTVDGRYRLQLHAGAGGHLVLLATVMTLPDDALQADRKLTQLLDRACALLHTRASGLCLGQDGHTLQLQQVLPAEIDGAQLDVEVEGFVNDLAFWTRECRAP